MRRPTAMHESERALPRVPTAQPFCKATECRLANGVPIIWCVCSHSTPYEQRGAADPRQPRRAPSLVSVVRRHRSLERVDLAVQQLQLRNDLSAVLRGHPRRPSLPPQSHQRSAAVPTSTAVKCGREMRTGDVGAPDPLSLCRTQDGAGSRLPPSPLPPTPPAQPQQQPPPGSTEGQPRTAESEVGRAESAHVRPVVCAPRMGSGRGREGALHCRVHAPVQPLPPASSPQAWPCGPCPPPASAARPPPWQKPSACPDQHPPSSRCPAKSAARVSECRS